MKQFDIPGFYRSPIIGRVKQLRKTQDPRKKDFTPLLLDFGPVRFFIPRHFGFCYGVENAVEIAYRTLAANPGKRVFLISEIIHNPRVNEDLIQRGIRFIFDTSGKQLIPWPEIRTDDIVITPAFGTTREIEAKLSAIGMASEEHNSTCPFVEKVWKESGKLGHEHYAVIIHGKRNHEETRATFSHSVENGPALVIENMEEARKLAAFILEEPDRGDFFEIFRDRYSPGFDPEKHLLRIGIVNQTTILATETLAIDEFLKETMIRKYGEAALEDHYADTRDTLCYATNDNQQATVGMLEEPADLAIVIGGYNSSNTTHLVELCENRLPTYFISSADEILSADEIRHFDYRAKSVISTRGFLPSSKPATILISAGASCPDVTVDEVLQRLIGLFVNTRPVSEVMSELEDVTA